MDDKNHKGRLEVWQKNIVSPDNLITLNEGVDKALPYAGIEVKRGEGKNPAYFLFAEDEKRWTTVKNGQRKDVAMEGDPISNFEWDLNTSEVLNTDGKDFFTRRKAGQAVRSGKGIEIKHTKEGATVHQKGHTSTHNFWVSNEVVQTKGTDKEILPAFVSSAEHEKKRATNVRCSLSTGTAKVFLKKNGIIAATPTDVDGYAEQEIDEPFEDGDLIGIGIEQASGARNLSVSITVETTFS